MKETGIIMSGNHPKLVLDGRKTQTRRTSGLKEINLEPDRWEYMRTNNDGAALFWVVANDPEPDNEKRFKLVKCPYGQVGDRLWVRETWAYGYTNQSPDRIIYKADNTPLPDALARGTYTASAGFGKWAPSIHMFRKDSRITLEITDIRVERVQEISFADRLAEGITYKFPYIQDTKRDFANLWDSLNAKRGYGWEVNPWVWVIGFKRYSTKND